MFESNDSSSKTIGQGGQVPDTPSRPLSSSSSTRSDDIIESTRPTAHPNAEDGVLDRCSTHHSLGPDMPIEAINSVVEVPDEVYDRLPPHRKLVIVFLLSFCSFLAPISSTSVLAATPEVAAEYDTTGSIINMINALYMLFMGLSPIFWGPLSQVYGRKIITVTTAIGFLGCSIGTALAPNLGAFFVFRLLTAFEGTSFILVGASVIGDMYRPTERATALGWFLTGTLVGPALGPFIGGIIVTYTSWRVIFWLQTGLAGIAAVGSYFLLPETIYHKKIDDLVGYSGSAKVKVLLTMINPWRVIRLWEYPNLFLTGIASASLVWNMYSLLTPIRYVLNSRYNLTTPMQGGLFYLAPGCGYLLGTFIGGRYADYVVKKYIKKRGMRIPEDRLYSALPFMGIVIPGCVLIYGWSVEKDVGGIPLTVVVLFLQGVAQLFCFPSLNTYCLDVMPGRGAEVTAGNYAIRYLFGCAGMAVVLPAIEGIGVGWFSTISALFVFMGTVCVYVSIKWGNGWRLSVDARRRRRARGKILDENNGNMRENAGKMMGGPATGTRQNPLTTRGAEQNKEEV
ncbi:MFS general substrate transporter [Daldinia decipiens]|uniref:MFS general substrate transporter n=1 Tax=Daldinia decipiens TaxID=326647 RepID=UPI0020C1E743|nr:MFS general substrate transporter [Daldinia decipiens]KAI1662512.1 MFS general substrate transporter [Daldinia decipiens]